MAKNKPYGDGHRLGEVKNRIQVLNPRTNIMVKINTETHKFMDNKTCGGKFKGVRTKK